MSPRLAQLIVPAPSRFIAGLFCFVLALLAPVLVAAELGLLILALREGWLREKARGWLWLAAHTSWLAARRRQTQAIRRVPDRDLARYLTPTLDPRMLDLSAAVTPANLLVAAWWRLVRAFL